MTAYININTKEYPLYQGDIRLIHPEISEEFICPPCFVEVKETKQIEPESDDYYIQEDTPKEIDGIWYQQWIQIPLSVEQKHKRDTRPETEPYSYVWSEDKKEWILDKIIEKELLESQNELVEE